MESYPMNMNEAEVPQGSIVKGLIGALLGALIGGIAWGAAGLLTQQVFALLGVLVGFLVGKGYELLKGREGAVKIVIIILCAILAIVLGETIYNFGMMHQSYLEIADEIGAEMGIDLRKLLSTNPDAAHLYIVTETEAFQMMLKDKEFITELLKNLGQALLFAALGAAAVIARFGQPKEQTVQPPAHSPEEPADSDEAIG